MARVYPAGPRPDPAAHPYPGRRVRGSPARSAALLGWISVLAGAVSWTTLDAINPFQPQPPRRAGEGYATWASSEPVLRAKADLDAALKDLEDRGLLWWDRSSNTYDLHPIIRAYAHDQLEDSDRVQANDRVRDHFQALPPENPYRATSVEDLTQSITIFRALIGANHLYEANRLWVDLYPVLLVDLGAYATVTELLTPLAVHGAQPARGDLAIAYALLGMFDMAISQNMNVLAAALKEASISDAGTALSRLSADFSDSAAYVAAYRCDELKKALYDANGNSASGSMYRRQAERAILEGDAKQAKSLLNRARGLHDGGSSPWFNERIEYHRLYLALVADESLTLGRLEEAATRARSLRGRRDLAELRCELLIKQEEFAQALAAAQEREQLGRNAGIDVAPAPSAFLLAKLGRTDESTAAVTETLARLPRIHPAQRPHLYLARALRELDRPVEATSHALAAYRQAWADGPPNAHHWNLGDARQLLEEMDEPVPDLPTIDPATVKVPLEDEVRAFIAALKARRESLWR